MNQTRAEVKVRSTIAALHEVHKIWPELRNLGQLRGAEFDKVMNYSFGVLNSEWELTDDDIVNPLEKVTAVKNCSEKLHDSEFIRRMTEQANILELAAVKVPRVYMKEAKKNPV